MLSIYAILYTYFIHPFCLPRWLYCASVQCFFNFRQFHRNLNYLFNSSTIVVISQFFVSLCFFLLYFSYLKHKFALIANLFQQTTDIISFTIFQFCCIFFVVSVCLRWISILRYIWLNFVFFYSNLILIPSLNFYS